MSIGPFDFTISDKDAAGNTMTLTGNVKITRATATPTYDAFGTKIIYPTKASGQVVNMNMTGPSSGLRAHFDGATFFHKTDGSWLITPDSDGLARVGLNSAPGNKWVNIEMTVYLKPVSGDKQFQLACMGGGHSADERRWGTAYKARVTGTPPPVYPNNANSTFFVKELGHGCYAEPQVGVHGGIVKSILTNVPDYNFGKWQGYKLCKYQIENTAVPENVIGRHPVVLELRIDANCQDAAGTFVRKNNWKLVNTWTDRGVWSAASRAEWQDDTWVSVDQDNNTGYRKPNEVINTGGDGYDANETTTNDCYVRTDGSTLYQMRDFSVREIDAAGG